MMAEDRFMDVVLNDVTYWKQGWHDVMKAVKRNAEDPQKSDQLVWVHAYAVLLHHPAAADLESVVRGPRK